MNVVVSGYVRDVNSSGSRVSHQTQLYNIQQVYRGHCCTRHLEINVSYLQIPRIITAMSKNIPEFHMLSN